MPRSRVPRRIVIALVLAGLIGSAGAATAARPRAPKVDPQFAPTGLRVYQQSEARALDQARNPDYHVRFYTSKDLLRDCQS